MSVSVHPHFSQDQLELTILGNPKIWKYSRKSRKRKWNIVFKWVSDMSRNSFAIRANYQLDRKSNGSN